MWSSEVPCRRYNPAVPAEKPQPTPVVDPQLDDLLEVSPDADVESWRLSVPAKGACYLLEDEPGRAILLATTADLRQALVHRLSAVPTEASPGKRAGAMAGDLQPF